MLLASILLAGVLHATPQPGSPVPHVTTTSHSVVQTHRSSAVWVEKVRRCIVWRESRGQYRALNRHSGASGAYQFMDSTWHHVTHLPGKAMHYSKHTQDAAFYKLFNWGKGRRNWYLTGGPQCW